MKYGNSLYLQKCVCYNYKVLRNFVTNGRPHVGCCWLRRDGQLPIVSNFVPIVMGKLSPWGAI